MALPQSYELGGAAILDIWNEAGNQLKIQLHESDLSIDILNDDQILENIFNETFKDIELTSVHQIMVKTFDKGKQMMVKLDNFPTNYMVFPTINTSNSWNYAEIGNDFHGCISSLILNGEGILKSVSGHLE